MNDFLNRAFNWKQHPANVFWLALPLFLLGFGSLAAQAVLHWRVNGDPAYAGIVLAGVAVLGIALVPAWRMHRTTRRLRHLTNR